MNGIGRQLFYLAFPIILGALAMPSVQTADLGIVTNSLLGMGYTAKEADALYGNISNVVNPLVNMPAILSLALAMSIVPAISESKARKDEAGVIRKADMGFKLALLVGLPCAAGFYLLSQPIIHLLYSSVQGQELETAGNLLGIMATGVLFLTIVQTTTGILQGLGKTYVPVINLFIGVAVKIAASLILIRIPELNIKGAAIGTVACYAIAGILDIICVIKYAHLKLKIGDHIIKPLFAAGVMAIFVYFTYPLLESIMPNKIATVMEIAMAGLLYLILVFAFVLKKDDMAFLPGGSRVTRVMEKLKIW
jgi:stage V sporulation protein B